MSILFLFIIIFSCTKNTNDKSEPCGNGIIYEYKGVTEDLNDWFPVNMNDTAIYIDSVGNELNFIATNLFSDTISSSYEDLTMQCTRNYLTEFEIVTQTLFNSQTGLTLQYTLMDRTPHILTLENEESPVRYSKLELKIPLSDNSSNNSIEYNDSLIILGKIYYNVFNRLNGSDKIYYSKIEGILAFKYIKNGTTYFYRKK